MLYPVYWSTFERGNDDLTKLHKSDSWNDYRHTEYLIKVVKDFKRCIDYLETRQDIDSKEVLPTMGSVGEGSTGLSFRP